MLCLLSWFYYFVLNILFFSIKEFGQHEYQQIANYIEDLKTRYIIVLCLIQILPLKTAYLKLSDLDYDKRLSFLESWYPPTQQLQVKM